MSSIESNILKKALFCLCVSLAFAASDAAGSRIFRCIDANGTQVFRDQPCSRAGMIEAGKSPPMVRRSKLSGETVEASCSFSSDPMPLQAPTFDATKLRLVVDIDADGPFLRIVASGRYAVADALSVENSLLNSNGLVSEGLDDNALEENIFDDGVVDLGKRADASPDQTSPGSIESAPRVATFDARVARQGFEFADGTFIEADWRMGEQILGFGRSRMRSLLLALSQQPASVVVWFEGFETPITSRVMPAEEFRLAVDNARRCWKTRTPG